MSRQKIAKDVPNFGQIGEISPNLVTLVPERFAFRRRRLIPVRSSVQPKTIIRWNWKKFLQTFFVNIHAVKGFTTGSKGSNIQAKKFQFNISLCQSTTMLLPIFRRELWREKKFRILKNCDSKFQLSCGSAKIWISNERRKAFCCCVLLPRSSQYQEGR